MSARSTYGFSIDPPWIEVGMIATSVSVQSMMGLLFVIVLVGIARAVKQPLLAVILMTLVFVLFDESRAFAMGSSEGWGDPARIALPLAWSFIVCFVLTQLYVRAGVLAAIAFIVTENVARGIPPLADWTAWHAWSAVAPAGFIALLALWGAGAASFGRPANDAMLDAGSSSRLRPRSA